MWFDLRTTDDSQLHGSGRRIENGADGMTIPIGKTAEAAGTLNICLYVILDTQMNIENGKLVDVLYQFITNRTTFSYNMQTDVLR